MCLSSEAPIASPIDSLAPSTKYMPSNVPSNGPFYVPSNAPSNVLSDSPTDSNAPSTVFASTWFKSTPQEKLDLIGNDDTSANLIEILNDVDKNLEIYTENGAWIENVYIPDGENVPTSSKVMVECNSELNIYVHYRNDPKDEWTTAEVQMNQRFEINLTDNNEWRMSFASTWLQSTPQEKLDLIGNDDTSANLINYLNDVDQNFEIYTDNGIHVWDVYIPDGEKVPESSKVTVECKSLWSINVHYRNDPNDAWTTTEVLTNETFKRCLTGINEWSRDCPSSAPSQLPSFNPSTVTKVSFASTWSQSTPQEKLDLIGDDDTSANLITYLNDVDQNLEIYTENGAHVWNIYIPDGENVPESSKVMVECKSWWSIYVHYRNDPKDAWTTTEVLTNERFEICLTGNDDTNKDEWSSPCPY